MYRTPLSALFLFSALSQNANALDWPPEDLQHRNIPNIPAQDRVEVIPTGFAKRIGWLEANTGNVCTATLIGSDIILTADHCTEDENLKTRDASEFTFYAGYSNGGYLHQSQIKEIIAPETSIKGDFRKKVKFSHDDTAIMVLSEPLGDVLGYEAVRTEAMPPEVNAQNPLKTLQIGYNHNYGPVMTADMDCEIFPHILTDSVLFNSCNVDAMDSGGPNFAWLVDAETGEMVRQIVGVTSMKRIGGANVSPLYRSSTLEDLEFGMK